MTFVIRLHSFYACKNKYNSVNEMPIDQVPYFHKLSDTALIVGGILQLGSPLFSVELLQQTGLLRSNNRESVEQVMFAYTIPYLPDVSTSSHIVAQNDREMLIQALEKTNSASSWFG